MRFAYRNKHGSIQPLKVVDPEWLMASIIVHGGVEDILFDAGLRSVDGATVVLREE